MKRAYEKLCNYTQQCPVTFGVGSISTVKDAMGMLGVKKLFVVYDQGVKMSGLAEKVTKSLDEQGIDYIAYDDITAEPVEDVVEKAYEVAEEAGCDSVLGLGGGSPMDTAKIVSVLLKQGGKVADWAIAKQLEQYGAPRMNDHVPSIMVPTSSGTGSEVTCVAVFSYLSHAKDGVLAGPSMAIVDPEMTVTCPPLNTVTSALDAFAHAAEAITAADVDPVSDQLALEAIRLIMGNLDTAYNDGTNIEARARLSMAANMAGIAFSNTGVSFWPLCGTRVWCGLPYRTRLGLLLQCARHLEMECGEQYRTRQKNRRGDGDRGLCRSGSKNSGSEMAGTIVKMMKAYKVPTLAEKGRHQRGLHELWQRTLWSTIPCSSKTSAVR